jgi:hypothetical protein
MIIYNILIGILILLLIYGVVLIIQKYNSKPIIPVGPPLNPQPIHPVNPISPVSPPISPPINPPVIPSPISSWTQDNLIELDSYLRKFFLVLFQNQREPIKDDTYKYIEKDISDNYTYTDYKNIFLDFSNIEYIGYYNVTNWKNKTFKPMLIPSDDNINLALFILQSLDKYQPLTKISFENIFQIEFSDVWKDKTLQIADCIYDTISKYNLTPTSYLFLTTLMGNINMSINYNKDSYPTDVDILDISKVFLDFVNNQQDPILDYCNTKIGS